MCSRSTYFFTDFRLLWVLSSNAAPTSGYRWAISVRIEDSEACVDGGDISPDDLVSPGKPETFVASGDVKVRFDVDATALVCILAYFDSMTVGWLVIGFLCDWTRWWMLAAAGADVESCVACW